MVAIPSDSPSSAAGSATAHLALARCLVRHYWRRFDELVPFDELHSEALLALSRAARYYPDPPNFAKVAAASMGRAVRYFCRWWLNRGGTALGKVAEDDPSEHEPPDHRTPQADQTCAQDELVAGFKELLARAIGRSSGSPWPRGRSTKRSPGLSGYAQRQWST